MARRKSTRSTVPPQFLSHNSINNLCSCVPAAFSTFLLALGITAGFITRDGPESFTFLYDKWLGFLTASLIMSLVQAVAVYAGSFRKGALLALGGNSGNPIYDVRRLLTFPMLFDIRHLLVFHRARTEPLYWFI